MCGRFVLKGSPSEIARMLGLDIVPNLEPRYNIAPGQDVLAVRLTDAGRAAVRLRWGLVPFWAKDAAIGNKMINARAETVAGKAAFRHAFRKRRCLIPADGFYEWQERGKGRPRQPFHIHKADGAPFAFAGLWERWGRGSEALESCTIVTTSAPRSLEAIHERVPVILTADGMEAWLATPEEAADGLQGLLAPLPDGELVAEPVSSAVNNVRNDGPECQEPAEVDEKAAVAAEERAGADSPGQGDLFG